MVDRQHRPGAHTGSGGVASYDVSFFLILIYNYRMLTLKEEKDKKNWLLNKLILRKILTL